MLVHSGMIKFQKEARLKIVGKTDGFSHDLVPSQL